MSTPNLTAGQYLLESPHTVISDMGVTKILSIEVDGTLEVSIGMVWVAAKRQWAARQRQAAADIEELGGVVRWDWCKLHEGGFLSEATNVSFEGTQVTDAGLERLDDLTHLLWLEFNGTDIRDSGLEYLKGLTRLRWLNLEATQVTDAGLEHLKSLRQLQGLSLCGTEVTDAGLHHLEELRQLDSLYLGKTGVTDAGLEQLEAPAPAATKDETLCERLYARRSTQK